MTGILRAELLKMLKRWMPYVLFLLMLIGAAAVIWLFGYASYHEDDHEYRATAMRTFVYPYSVVALLDSGQFWGSAFFVAILTTSTLATEHNWGTVRTALTGGVSRTRYLTAKLLVLMLVSTAALLAALAFGVLLSLWASSAADFNIPAPHPDGFAPADVLLMISRTAYCILPYGLLAFAITVISRSTAMGIAGTMGYMTLEGIAVALLGTGGDALQDSRYLFLGHSVTVLMAENRFADLDFNTIAFRDLESPGQPGIWVATAIVGLQSLAFLAASFFVFLRRDITVSHG
jgi:ABC-type transport system involved in multi-copper enzyme maturation permease subunit